MEAYKEIENLMATKYGKSTTTRKAIGDFMLSDNHAREEQQCGQTELLA